MRYHVIIEIELETLATDPAVIMDQAKQALDHDKGRVILLQRLWRFCGFEATRKIAKFRIA